MAATNAVPVDASNMEQLRAWDGDEGAYWAAHADYFDRSAIPYHQRLLAAAAIGEGDRVLDIGCGPVRPPARGPSGDGRLCARGRPVVAHARLRPAPRRRRGRRRMRPSSRPTRRSTRSRPGPSTWPSAAPPRCSSVTTSPRSPTSAGVAPRRTARARDLAAAAGQRVGPRDLRRARRGTRPPGPAAGRPSPFALSDPDRVRSVLTSAGFADVELEGTSAGMWFGTDADDAHQFVLGLMGWMLEGLDDAGRARAIDALRATMAAHETPDGVIFDSAVWIIRATRP